MNKELNPQKDPNFLLSTMDAQVWATEYCRLNPGADMGNMIGWFANAIMVGFDEATRRKEAERTTSPVQVEVFSTHEVIGKIIDQMSQLQMLWGLNEPGALVRFREVSDVLFAASRACRASLAAAAPQAQDNDGEKA